MSNPQGASGSRKKRASKKQIPPPIIPPPSQGVYRPTMVNQPSHNQCYSQGPVQNILPNIYSSAGWNEFIPLSPASQHPSQPQPQHQYYSQPPLYHQQSQQPFHHHQSFNLQDEDDEEDFVPETQTMEEDSSSSSDDMDTFRQARGKQPQPVQDTTKKGKFAGRAERKEWTHLEMLAMAWCHVSENPITGDGQKRDSFYNDVLEHYHVLTNKNPERSRDSLYSRWGVLNHDVAAFNGLYIQATQLRASGCSDVDVLKRAHADYLTIYKKTFKNDKAWEVLRNHQRWLTQDIVTDMTKNAIPKRKRVADPTPDPPISNEGSYNPDLPNINVDDDIPTPRSRRDKRKEKDDSSSKTSLSDSLKSYTDKKSQFLEEKNERGRVKHEEQLKLYAKQTERLDAKQE